MTFHAKWYKEERVVLITLEGNATGDDIRGMDKAMTEYLHAGSAPVFIILDASGVDKVTVSITEARGAVSAFKHPNFGWTLIVGTNAMVKFIGSIVTQLIRARVRMMDSMDQALTFIISQDESLSDIKKDSA